MPATMLGCATDPAALLSLSLLSANFTVVMTFTTGGTAPSGDIGVRLFDQPQGLAQASRFQCDVQQRAIGRRRDSGAFHGVAGLP